MVIKVVVAWPQPEHCYLFPSGEQGVMGQPCTVGARVSHLQPEQLCIVSFFKIMLYSVLIVSSGNLPCTGLCPTPIWQC